MRVLLWLGIIGGILFLIGWAFLFEAYTVPDNSMAPNLVKGDKVLVYLYSGLDRGSPVVCQHPNDASQKIVARIVGKPGDEVKLMRASLYINDSQAETSVEGDYVLVDEQETGSPRTVKLQERIETVGMIRYRILWPARGSALSNRRQMRQKRIRDGQYFLLADNRAFGTDSRVWGAVEISSCIGRPLLIYHPGRSSGDAGSGSRWFNFIQ
jgi:signal peptidase I